jgi:ribose transport system permease protein
MKVNASDLFKRYGIYSVLVVLILIFAISSRAFFSSSNIFNIARQVSMLGISAVGMTFTLLVAGIDLSVGSIVTLVNIIVAYFMVKAGVHPVLACMIGLVISTFCGFLNGAAVANLGMPPLIVTLCSMTVLEGLAYVISRGAPIFGFTPAFTVIGQGYVWFIPIPVIIMAVILCIGAFILNATYFGRYFYAVGGNEEASNLSGINVRKVKYLAYSLSGFFAGIAGVVMLSRTNSGQPLAGKGFEFDVVTAVVLGGVSVSGGSGKISNVVAGVFIMGVLSNGMVLLNISQYIQMVTKGLVLFGAVAFDCLQKNGRLNFKFKNVKKSEE